MIRLTCYGLGVLLTLAKACSLYAEPQDAGQRTEGSAWGQAAKIEFASTTFNFGEVVAGEPVKRDFVFTNTGLGTLEILEVQPGCGCTTAGAWDHQVEPGRTGVIPLQFNSSAFSGLVAKSAAVVCNDPIASNIVLQLTGKVWKPIEITPPSVSFDFSTETQGSQTKVLSIVSHLSEPLTFSELQCTNTAFRVEMKTVQPGKEYELHISVAPPLPSSSIFTAVTLKTSYSQLPLISVNASATLQPIVALVPEQLFLPLGPLKHPVTSALSIRNNGTNDLKLSDAQVDVPGVGVTITELEPGRLFTLQAVFPAGLQIAPDRKAELTVRSSHPEFPIIKVPISQSHPPVPVLSRSLSPATRVIPTRSPVPDTASK